MLLIVNGNDTVSSRRFFLEQKTEDCLTFDAENLEISELIHSLRGDALFGSTKKIFLENLFSRKSVKNYKPIVEALSSNEADVFIWTDKELGAKTLSDFPKHTLQNFKIPQNIFSFLDSIKPNSTRNVVNFHNALLVSDVEVIFAMIVRQVRIMLALSEDSKNNIDEVKRLAPWQRSKLVNQASLFGKEKLVEIHKKLYKMDKNQKTGGSNLTLTQNIDILLLEI